MGILTNQACADAIKNLSFDQIPQMNDDMTGCRALIPKGTAGTGLNETDYDELKDNLNNKNDTDLASVQSILESGTSDFILVLGDDSYQDVAGCS